MLKEPLQLEGFEISPRFRQTVEERVARLEKDADWDEAQIANLENIEHIRRQMRLVAAQRAEASRMRSFLDRSRTRVTQPVVAL
jgi:ribosome-associated translation inhibitor RaiA